MLTSPGMDDEASFASATPSYFQKNKKKIVTRHIWISKKYVVVGVTGLLNLRAFMNFPLYPLLCMFRLYANHSHL